MPLARPKALPLLLGLLLFLAASPAWAGDAARQAQTEALVKEACALLTAQGRAAFPAFNQPESRWLGQDRSLFIFDEDGLELVSNAFPDLVGANVLGIRDDQGRYTAREELALVRAQGAGWLEARWPRPGQSQPAPCRVYVRAARLEGKLLVVGSCYWL